MSDRHPALMERAIRSPREVLEANSFYTDLYDQAKARLTVEGQTQMHGQLEKAMAAGEPGLLQQQIPNYISEEALVRTFATGFGNIVREGSADQIPEYSIAEPESIKILTVAVTGGRGGPRRRKIYRVQETQATGSWKEITTEPVEIPFVNPFFPRKRAMLVANAADFMAYALAKEMDNIAFTILEAGLKATFAASDKVWSYKDSDVSGVPTGNKSTGGTDSIWKTFRTLVLPFFLGAGKANRVINVYVNHLDVPKLYAVAPQSATLGGYSDFQREVYENGVEDMELFGHRFRLIPVNWKIAVGRLIANVGPVFKMWLPPQGDVAQTNVRPDGSEVRIHSRIYEILSPSPWWTNVYSAEYDPNATS